MRPAAYLKLSFIKKKKKIQSFLQKNLSVLCPRQYQEFFSNGCFLYSSTERSPLHVIEFVGITYQAHRPPPNTFLFYFFLSSPPRFNFNHKSSNQEGEVQAKMFAYSNNLTIFNKKKKKNVKLLVILKFILLYFRLCDFIILINEWYG